MLRQTLKETAVSVVLFGNARAVGIVTPAKPQHNLIDHEALIQGLLGGRQGSQDEGHRCSILLRSNTRHFC
jgi:hypothetical protein